MRLLLLFGLAAGGCLADEMWVELGPASGGFVAIARYASAAGNTCPSIELDGRAQAMRRRVNTGKFAALVCQFPLPAGTATAKINGQALPIPAWTRKANPVIVVIGDTGCRIKQGGEDSSAPGGKWNIQDCASSKDWPFDEVAEHASAEKPDLVIHVGDYLYREKACTGVKGCPGGPAGDTLETWEADFFTPARKLLLAAPWVFVRGNHEDCTRAGDGWFTLLDPRVVKTCVTYSGPYLLRTNVTPPLAMLDTNPALDVACADGDNKCAAEFPEQVETYSKAFATISSWKLQGGWMLTHKPVWSVKAGNTVPECGGRGGLEKWPAQGNRFAAAGHTHTFEMIGFDAESDHAMQLVVGNGGTKLAPKLDFDSSADAVRAAQIADFRKKQDFGYTTLRPTGSSLNVLAHARDGAVDIACDVVSGKANCTKGK